MEIQNDDINFVDDIKQLIHEARNNISRQVNLAVTILNWNVGFKINERILNYERAEYGLQLVKFISEKLTEEFGKGWGEKHLRHCLRFAETFKEKEIVYALSRELSWTHLRTITYVPNELAREFYIEICRLEKWDTRTLAKKIDSMLFERTAISKKPEKVISEELKKLRNTNVLSPDFVFRDPYILDFLGLEKNFNEKTFEDAILKEIEKFLLELGHGFTFVERQKSIIVDGEHYKIDLLFYHRKLKRLVAIDLKIGRFKAAYKGQMELYLRYLEKNEVLQDENPPIELLLCAEGNYEQIELLQLDKAGIRVAEYVTELPSKEILQKKLHNLMMINRSKIDENSEN
jgi:predicted nuclease of restriction endonuclease-like (RecB) superfamily